MKTVLSIACLTILLVFLLGGCTESPITEVGNPTAAPAKATTATLESGLESVFGFFAGGAGGFTCVFDEATETAQCNCGGGGTFTQTFLGDFTSSGGAMTFNHDFEQEYRNCSITACGLTVVLDGRATGHVSGQADPATRTFSATGEFLTATPCSGLTANGEAVGFSVTSSSNETASTTTGTICVGGQTFAFDSLTDLESQIDPSGACTD